MSEENSFLSTKTQRIILLVIILLLLCGFGFNQVKIANLNKDVVIARQNEFALGGILLESKTKNGELEFSKGVLVTKNGDLESLSSTLKEEYDKESGKVHRLQRIIAKMSNERADGSIDTLEMTNTVYVYPNGDQGLKWGDTTYYDSSNFRQIAGISDFKIVKVDSNNFKVVPLTTKITNDAIGFNIITGLKTNKETGMVEIFVRSDFPNFSVMKLEGAIIDPEKDPIMKKFTQKKKFTVGPYVGYGLNFSNGTIGYGVQIGIGGTYNFFSF